MPKKLVVFLIFIAMLSGCEPHEPALITSQNVADEFSNVCLSAPNNGRTFSEEFRSNLSYSPSSRPLPGPRTTVFEGPQIVGVTQRLPKKNEPTSRSCAVYATVSDLDQVHIATNYAIKSAYPNATLDPSPEQASESFVSLPDGREMRVVSSRLGPSGGMINPVPGNVRIIVYLDDTLSQ